MTKFPAVEASQMPMWVTADAPEVEKVRVAVLEMDPPEAVPGFHCCRVTPAYSDAPVVPGSPVCRLIQYAVVEGVGVVEANTPEMARFSAATDARAMGDSFCWGWAGQPSPVT